jgi:hypothetical protein
MVSHCTTKLAGGEGRGVGKSYARDQLENSLRPKFRSLLVTKKKFHVSIPDFLLMLYSGI